MLGGPEGVGLAVPGECPWHPRMPHGGAGWWEWAVRRCAHKGNRCVLELRNGGPGPGRGFGADPPHSEIVYAEHAPDDPEHWLVHESVLTYRDQAHRDRVFEGLVRRMLLGDPPRGPRREDGRVPPGTPDRPYSGPVPPHSNGVLARDAKVQSCGGGEVATGAATGAVAVGLLGAVAGLLVGAGALAVPG